MEKIGFSVFAIPLIRQTLKPGLKYFKLFEISDHTAGRSIGKTGEPVLSPSRKAQCSITLFILLLFTRFWLISALYAVWWAFDWDTPSKGGRSSHRMRNSVVWRYMKDYFPVSLVKTADLDPSKNYIFGFHPHAIFPAGGFINLCTEANGFSKHFPGLKLHTMMLSMLFRVPFFRDYWMSLGFISSSKESASYVLRKKEGGNIVMIGVGGAKEALDAHPEAYTLVIQNRKGFVRLAIENGTPLVPVFSFGENELYDQIKNPKGSWLRWTQDRLQKIMGFSLPLFYARGVFQYTFGFIPYRKPLFTVVGKPIQVEKKHNPSQDEVDELHKRYLEALCKLFEEHKLKYNVPEDTHLSFI